MSADILKFPTVHTKRIRTAIKHQTVIKAPFHVFGVIGEPGDTLVMYVDGSNEIIKKVEKS